MKKVLLIVATLLVVSPVMAQVTITAVQGGTYWADPPTDQNQAAIIRICYSLGPGDPNIRAFALDINVDSNCGFWNVSEFNVGENNYPSKPNGYGIFPGRFRQYINPIAPNWGDGNYSPLTYYNDPGASNTGIGWPIAVAELGYLGAGDSNMPARSGTLFRIDVNSYGWTGTAHLTIAADTMRGGIVSKDSNATIAASATNLNPTATFNVVFPPPGTTVPVCVGLTRDQCIAALNGVGLGHTDTNSPGTGQAMRQVLAIVPIAGTVVTPGSSVDINAVSWPIKATSSLSANWITNGRPACWAYPRQCHGDADGKKAGQNWVTGNDLTILKGALNVSPLPTGGTCADFDHKKAGQNWVTGTDLAILKANLNTAPPMCGDTSVKTDPNFWYWCNPTGGTCPTSPAGQVCAAAGTCPNSP